MLPGTFLHTLLPTWQAGTHCAINRSAHRIIRRYRRKRFPKWQAINAFEGLNGIDGLWLHNKHLPSRSCYDPMTQEGNGLQEIWEQFVQLQDAWSISDQTSIARQCAYLSHIIADIHTPTHQYGRIISPRRRMWYVWKLIDDWEERNHNNHLAFEAMLCWRFMRLPVRVRGLDYRLVRRFKRARDKQAALTMYVHNRLKEINQLRIYPEYIKRGWTKRIERAMQRRVLPQAARTVATIWYLAT